jgi:predicted RNA-binding protein with PUA-like domain
VDVRALKKIPLIALGSLRQHKALKDMVTLRPGNRLSITPVTDAQWKYITTKLL